MAAETDGALGEAWEGRIRGLGESLREDETEGWVVLEWSRDSRGAKPGGEGLAPVAGGGRGECAEEWVSLPEVGVSLPPRAGGGVGRGLVRRRARQGDLRDRQGDERDEMETQGGKEESTWQERARMREEEGNGDWERERRGGWKGNQTTGQ